MRLFSPRAVFSTVLAAAFAVANPPVYAAALTAEVIQVNQTQLPNDVPLHAEPTNVEPLNLEQVLLQAEQASPELQQAIAVMDDVLARLNDASSWLNYNPNLTMEQVNRRLPDEGNRSDRRFKEWSIGLEQTFEIAGQQGLRKTTAIAEQSAQFFAIEYLRKQVRAQAEAKFVDVLAIQRHSDIEQQALIIIEDTAASVLKRVTVGEDSRLDGNLAQIEVVRARNQLGRLYEQLINARTELANALQISLENLPSVQGQLNLQSQLPNLSELLNSADQQPLLRHANLKEEAAKNALQLQRAMRYPNITVGLSHGLEGAYRERERLTTLSISIPLPFFDNNTSAIGRASANWMQSQIVRRQTHHDLSSNITALWQKRISLQSRVTALSNDVMPALQDNQQLSLKSFKAGEIDLFQMLLINRQMLDGQRDLIDAKSELRHTNIALQLLAP